MKMNTDIKVYLSSIGTKAGKAKSNKKTVANRQNAKKRWDDFYKKSGIKKLA